MKAIDVLKKLSDRNTSVMDGTQLVVSLGDINDAIAEIDLMTCENCMHFMSDKSEDGTDGYCRIIRMATTLEGVEEGVFLSRYNSSSCNEWMQK